MTSVDDRSPAGRERLHSWGTASWDMLRILALLAVVIWLLYQVRIAVIPLMLGSFAASLGTPIASRLVHRGLPPLLATWIVGIGFGGSVFLLGWFVVAEVQGAAEEMGVALTEAWEQLRSWLGSIQFGPDGQSLIESIEQFFAGLADDGGLGTWLSIGFETVTEAIAGLFLSIVVAFFIVKDGERFWAWVLSKVPGRHRLTVETAGSAAWSTLRRYLFGTSLVGLVNAIAVGVALVILGVPLVVPLAILMFLGAYFPLVGAIFSGSVVVLTVLATNGLRDAVIVAIVVIAVQQLEGDLVAPIVLGRAVALHPLLVLFGVTIGFVVAGIIGAFVAVPLIAIAAQVIRTTRPSLLTTG